MTFKPAVAALLVACSVPLASVRAGEPASRPAAPALVGTWVLAAADDLKPDGTRVPAYGAHPRGLLVLGADGRYALQIYGDARPRYASGDKRRGTPEEYKATVLGLSTHFGRYVVEAATLTFHIESASFANWEGTEQKRPFTLSGDQLSYRVPATPDGTVPVSVWRRAP